jgi:hypothetical protein
MLPGALQGVPSHGSSAIKIPRRFVSKILHGPAPTPLENDFGEMEDYFVLGRRCNKIARE